MEEIERMIWDYNLSFKILCDEFVKKYYSDEDVSSDYYIIWEWGNLCPNVIDVNEYFWGIEDIYVALKHNIPEDKLFKYYEYSLNKSIVNKQTWWDYIQSLYNFYSWDYIYTEEEEKSDEDIVKEYYNKLRDNIKPTPWWELPQ